MKGRCQHKVRHDVASMTRSEELACFRQAGQELSRNIEQAKMARGKDSSE